MIIIPRRKQKIKYSRKIACKHLEPKGDISNSLQPLCYCHERELILGPRAYVCQVCYLYEPNSNVNMSEIYEKSKKIAEKKIKEELKEFEIEDVDIDEDVDLSIDEFEEDEEQIPLKFEKRKAGKEALEEGEEFAISLECPFCGDQFSNLGSHIQECEFAPDDASIEDILPSKRKKKRKRGVSKAKTGKANKGTESKKTKKCPYCGKEFIRLGRHLNSCKKKPKETNAGKEKQI
ncbi:MAG: hypothetical protein EU540_07000 [Promethearchaeota archaeon]|nr:MAG: hypothetical protein EU540_07000 [Candidatus Lokiarchaeota archaeon]